MALIASASFSDIQPLMGIDSNPQAIYSAMRAILGPTDSRFFARPDFPRANAGQWLSDVPGLRPLSEATEKEKSEVGIKLEKEKNRLLPKLRQRFPDVADLFFRVPDENAIFFTRENGEITVVLAEWSYEPCTQGQNTDVIDWLIKMPKVLEQVDAKVRVLYSDAKPADKARFGAFIFGHDIEFTTDADGMYSFGKMNAGQQFAVYRPGDARFDFTVEEGKSVYEARFDLTTTYDVTFIDQFGEPVTDVDFAVDGRPVTIDAGGKCAPRTVVLQPDHKITVSSPEGQSETFGLSRNPEANHFVFRMTRKLYTDYDVTVLNRKDEPQPGYAITIDGRFFTTDGLGKAREQGVEFTDGMSVTVASEKYTAETYILSADPAENHFIYRIPEPEETILEDPPAHLTDYDVTVVNRKDEPQPGYAITVDGKPFVTDTEGKVRVQGVEFADGMSITVASEKYPAETYVLSADASANHFTYRIPEPEDAPVPKPPVHFRLLDLDKTPLDDLDFTIELPKGKILRGHTDSEGWCSFPGEEFPEKKCRQRIRFTITKEYRARKDAERRAREEAEKQARQDAKAKK